jgi:hypothetical protein
MTTATTPDATEFGTAPAIPADAWRAIMQLGERLDRIDELLLKLVERQTVKEWYAVDEFARLVGREPFTCREWCRLGRIAAEKKGSGRGPHAAWCVSHEELTRYEREGLRPIRR